MNKMRQTENRLEEEKKNLRNGLEDAENRYTKLELVRRSTEGELQRMKLALTDKDTENQVCFVSFGLLCINSLTLSQTTNFRLFQTERVCRRQFKI